MLLFCLIFFGYQYLHKNNHISCTKLENDIESITKDLPARQLLWLELSEKNYVEDSYDEFQLNITSYGSSDLLYVISRIKNALEKEYTENNGLDGNSINPLKEPYILLQNLNKSKINEEKFVDSEIFRIIAESETPKISKQEIIDYLKIK